jgi:peptidyl-prolyl cis-trans isomerase SurA
MCAVLTALTGLAQAQQAPPAPPSLPGLIVSVPPAQAPAASPQPTPPAAAPPTAAKSAPAKPKPKPAAVAPAAQTASAAPSGKGSGGGQAVVVFVNDEPITAYDVDQRARLMSLQSNISHQAQENMKRLVQSEATQKAFRAQVEEVVKANQATKTREQIIAMIEERKKVFAESLRRQAVESARASALPGQKKNALEELIDERLKLQEAKRLGITVDDAQVDGAVKGLAQRNNVTEAQFAQNIKSMGADIAAMKSRIRATMAWQEVVRRRFGPLVAVNQRDVDKLVSTASGGEDQVEMQLHRIVLAVPGKLDQRLMAQRFDEAERIRARFGGCKTTAGLAGKLDNARFEDLGHRKLASIGEPTRSLLYNAKDGEMVPPTLSNDGVELYAVCSRKVIKADDEKRTQVQQELQQKEFEVLARRHLRDLRQDAHIEYR